MNAKKIIENHLGEPAPDDWNTNPDYKVSLIDVEKMIQAASLSSLPSDSAAEVRALLREVSMRANIAFPENEQDEKWFTEKFYMSKQSDLMQRLFAELELGQINHNNNTGK